MDHWCEPWLKGSKIELTMFVHPIFLSFTKTQEQNKDFVDIMEPKIFKAKNKRCKISRGFTAFVVSVYKRREKKNRFYKKIDDERLHTSCIYQLQTKPKIIACSSVTTSYRQAIYSFQT